MRLGGGKNHYTNYAFNALGAKKLIDAKKPKEEPNLDSVEEHSRENVIETSWIEKNDETGEKKNNVTAAFSFISFTYAYVRDSLDGD